MAKGMFERMADILRSNINEVLDRAEDPEKLIRQMIREMEEAVKKATASVGTAVANQKRLERQHDERIAQVEDWQRKAERAVEAGEDELARRALERKTVLQSAVDELAPAVEESRRTAQQLREQLRELKGKLEEARTRQGTLMARHRAAEACKQLAQSLQGLGDDAFSSFERFEQRVEESEAQAEAHTEVASDLDDVERRVRDLDRGASVEQELRCLKQRLLSERDAARQRRLSHVTLGRHHRRKTETGGSAGPDLLDGDLCSYGVSPGLLWHQHSDQDQRMAGTTFGGSWARSSRCDYLVSVSTITRGASQFRSRINENRILCLARDRGGRLTAMETATETGLTAVEAEAILRGLAEGGFIEIELTDAGVMVYRFPDVLYAPGGRSWSQRVESA